MVPCTSREEVLEFAAELGWSERGENKKGYIKLACGCGNRAHKMVWVHKTPSNPNYWRNRCNHMKNTCDLRPGNQDADLAGDPDRS